MRRALFLLIAVILAACATPAIRLSPVALDGEVRTYSLTAEATTAIRFDEETIEERRELTATARIEVLEAGDVETTLRVGLTPTSLAIDGSPSSTPEAQQAEIVVGLDGELLRIQSIDGLPPEVSGASVEDLLPLLGARLPTGRVHVGYRWDRTLPPAVDDPTQTPGRQTGRVEGLAVAAGYDCALLHVGTERPLTRQRSVEGQPVQLVGSERSASSISFAFRHGFPVRIETDAHGRFVLDAGAGAEGSVTIRAHTVLMLTGRQSS